MSETKKSWNLLKLDASKLGRVTIECGGDVVCVDPRDRVRICDVGDDAADEYTNRKMPLMRGLVSKLGLTGKVYCAVGEKGHLEFSLNCGE